jgi:5-deoxy-glucuronate isomerase
MRTGADDLLFRSRADLECGSVINHVTAQDAGWELQSMEVRRLAAGDAWSHDTAECEAALVLLGGICSVTSNRGEWPRLGRRPNVFSGMPHALYLPRHTQFTLVATSDSLEVAHCWVPTDQDHPAQAIAPEACEIELRGGHGATRQINSIIPPGFDCHRIVCVEVFTPGGNWSSYPPHKHDVHRVGEDGELLEADLEEFYCYKIAKPGGYALQRIYTDDRALDATVVAHDGDIVTVPEGYHPVSAAYGYDCYYLNFLSGSAQSLACVDDPDHAWVKDTWTGRDSRVPMVTHGMEPRGPR